MSALKNNSIFYYGISVTDENNMIDLIVSGLPVSIEIPVASYTPKEFEAILNELFSDVYSVGAIEITFDRETKSLVFDPQLEEIYFKFLTGPNNAKSAHELLGFTKTDIDVLSPTSSYFDICKEYITQFPIQSYLPTNKNRKARDGVVNKTASGAQEVIKFGYDRYMEGEMLFITNIDQRESDAIRHNENGVDDYISLVEWLTDKKKVEFMENVNNRNIYQILFLDSTEQASTGLDYKLIEMYDRGLPFYYRSGTLKFLLVDGAF